MSRRIQIPLYHKVWWNGDVSGDTATVRLMAFNGRENIILEERTVSPEEYERLKFIMNYIFQAEGS